MSNIRTFWSLLENSETPPTPPGVFYSFTEIPYANPDLINPGRGAEDWPTAQRIPNPTTSDTTENSLDKYDRFQWVQLEGATQGSYNWSTFDTLINAAIDNGQKFSFGVFSHDSGGGQVSYGGGTSAYPLYLHTLMFAEATNSKDWLDPSSNVWVPNWNSPNYLARLRALFVALNAHIQATSHSGVSYKDAIYTIDIRGYGNWGEWHIGSMTAPPTGRAITIATGKEIIDCHTEVFQDWPLSAMVAVYDGGMTGIALFPQFPELAHYALTATNGWGDVGFRRDQWGDPAPYLHNLMENNTVTYLGSPTFGSLIVNKYKTAPVTGEPDPISSNMIELESQVQTLHATSFGNGNYGANPDLTVANRIRAAFKRCGYRLKITTGEAPQIITRTVSFTIKTNWVNVGIAPTYENWDVQFELQTGLNVVVWSAVSTKILKFFRPDQGTVLTTDTFTVPGSVASGTYKLVVRVKDPLNVRENIKLAINTQNADGSYTIFTSVTVN